MRSDESFAHSTPAWPAPSTLSRRKVKLLEYTKSVKTRTRNSSPRMAVLGVGNLLLKDEGIGVHVVEKLTEAIDDANIKIIDAGTYPDFLSLVEDNLDKLIVIDAVKNGDKPGTIYRFDFDMVDLEGAPSFSVHDIGVVESLRTMALFNKQPKSTVVIGIEPKTIDFGLELSPEVEEKLPKIIDLVIQEIKQTTAMEVDR
jgi:hydrogenase maturation protease